VSSRLQTFRLAATLALRITRSRARDTISVVTALSVIGIACGVFALTVVLSVSDGFERAFEERILGIYPHLMVTRTRSDFDDWREVREVVAASPGVTGATPLSHHRMMASRGGERAEVSLQGVDPETLGDVIDLKAILRSGDLGALSERPRLVRAPTTAGEVRLRLAGLVTGGVHTVVLEDGAEGDAPAATLVDDHLRPPEVGRALLRVLDLRGGETAREVRLLGRTGENAEKTHGSGDALVFTPRGRAVTPDASATPGFWRLVDTGELLELREGWVHLLILDLDARGTGARATLLAEPHAPQPELARAEVRVVDLRTRGPQAVLVADGLGEAPDARPFATMTPSAAGADGPPLPSHTGFTPIAARLPPVLLGAALAKKLRAGLGDAVTFVTMQRALGLEGGAFPGVAPSAVRFRVAGIFASGFHEQDVSLAITHLADCGRFMHQGEVVEALAVRTDSVMRLDATRDALKRAIDPVPFEDLLTQALDLDARLAALGQMGEASPLATPARSGSPFIDRLEAATRAVELTRG
jgi:hypothetical protein